MTSAHPAVQKVLQEDVALPGSTNPGDQSEIGQTTSLTLARVLSMGCLGRLDPEQSSVNIWDPAAGAGFAGHMLAAALHSSGVHVRYRGQDISAGAVATSRNRFGELPDSQFAVANSLERDAFEKFEADLVIVDPPWSMDWKVSKSVVIDRQQSGSFTFGLPGSNDSIWLFISLALEKLRPAATGGGRVAALVPPSALSTGGSGGRVRHAIVEAGFLESVTRLPDGLAPGTSIPLYLLTFSNRAKDVSRNKVKVADFQTSYIVEDEHRSMPSAALRELEFGLRTGKSGPRNRVIPVQQLLRRGARLSRTFNNGQRISWRTKTYGDLDINGEFISRKYGLYSKVKVDGHPDELYDLNPGPIFRKDARDVIKLIHERGWQDQRLVSLLTSTPEVFAGQSDGFDEGQLFIPANWKGEITTDLPDVGAGGRIISVRVDSDLIKPEFLAAWLNSEQGVSSQRRAHDVTNGISSLAPLRLNPRAVLEWADEVIVPVPPLEVQRMLASADVSLRSFQSELVAQRAAIWDSPDTVEEVVSRFSESFEDSLSGWLDRLPFPIATALWTARTASTPGDQQQAYIRAWEAIATFHATVLLSAVRSDLVDSRRIENDIRETLESRGLDIDRASFKTWVVIVEKTSKELRAAVNGGDADDVARVRRAFGGLGLTGIERLVSKELVKKFNELNTKRNRWLGHAGYTSEEEQEARIDSLVADLHDLRQILGNVWTQLLLVRAGVATPGREKNSQLAEVAIGSKSPFVTKNFNVGELMVAGDLYLLRDGSEFPLRLAQFVQLRSAPKNAQYTTYFYSRTERDKVQMISYQYGAETELQDEATDFHSEFGALGG